MKFEEFLTSNEATWWHKGNTLLAYSGIELLNLEIINKNELELRLIKGEDEYIMRKLFADFVDFVENK